MSAIAPSFRDALVPPDKQANASSFAMALLCHAILLAALAWGTQWQHRVEPEIFAAEIWASSPNMAAPTEGDTAIPDMKIADAMPAAPVASAPPAVTAPNIVNERTPAPETKPNNKDIPKDLSKEKGKQVEGDKAKEKKQDKAVEKAREDERQANIKRMLGLAGQTDPNDKGNKSGANAAPSASYAAAIKARIRPNIVFTDDINGNPQAEVEVSAAPEGSIVGKRLLKSSGNKAWDDAVLRAIDRTDALPRDVDGRVPRSLIISFRPKE